MLHRTARSAAACLSASLLAAMFACPVARAAPAMPSSDAATVASASRSPVPTDAAMAARSDLRIGVLTPEGSYDALFGWDFMRPYLARALPQDGVWLRKYTHAELRRAIEHGSVDYFIANSGFYVEMAAAFGASPIATLETPQVPSPTQAHGATFVVAGGRGDLQTLRDVAGRRVVAVHELAFAGYQVGLHALQKAGVARGDLASLAFTGLPAHRLLDALRDGTADVAILRSCLLEYLVAKEGYRAADFRVLEPRAVPNFACAVSSDLYPGWAFARLKHVDGAQAKRVARALLEMPTTEEGQGWTVPTDHASVFAVFRDLEIGPYAYDSDRSLTTLLRRHRDWILALVVLLLGALVHVVRVEYLVWTRTRALREALDERDRIAAEARARDVQFDHLSRLGVLGEMSTMLAHELNQPLAAISNFSRGIVRRLQAGRGEPAPLIEAGEEIHRQAERAAGIMQRIREFARKRPAERVDADLRGVIDDAVQLFQGMLPHAPRVARDFDPSCLHGTVRLPLDRLQIEQVLLNLMKNAFDAMQGVDPDARCITIRCRIDDRLVRIEVADNGAGADAAAVERLFEPFFTTKPEGVGLGLSICRTVIEAHGGRIEARRNAPAPGLTLALALPLPGIEEGEAWSGASSAVASARAAGVTAAAPPAPSPAPASAASGAAAPVAARPSADVPA